jgi:hypothetical protein
MLFRFCKNFFSLFNQVIYHASVLRNPGREGASGVVRHSKPKYGDPGLFTGKTCMQDAGFKTSEKCRRI